MDAVDKAYTKKALEQTAEHFDIAPAEVRLLVKSYNDYLYGHINKIDITKDLSKQTVRFVIPYVGAVYFNKLILAENDLRHGRLTEEEMSWTRVWFPRTYKFFEYTLDKYKALFKTTEDD